MKKVLLTTLALGLAVALASPVAAADFTTSGWIGITGSVAKNLNGTGLPPAANINETGSWVGLRSRVLMKWAASKDLYGVWYFEIDSTYFGEPSGTRNAAGYWGADRAAVEVKQLYINFRIPPKLPLWMRVGVISMSHRTPVFASIDGAGAQLQFKVKDPVPIAVTQKWGMVHHGNNFEAGEDAQFYLTDANVGVGPAKVGVYFAYEKIRNQARVNAQPGSTGAGQQRAANFYWIGLYTDAKVAGINANFDFYYAGGEAEGRAGFSDVDYSGFLVKLIASYIWNKLEVGLGGFYASGNDYGDADDWGGVIVPNPSNGMCAACGDSIVVSDGWAGTDVAAKAPGLVGFGPQYWVGHWWVKMFSFYQVAPWLKLGGQVLYVGDTEEDGDAFIGANPSDGGEIGWEFDVVANVKLYKNLQWNTGFGYLFAGSALRVNGSIINDPWSLVTNLLYRW